MRHICTVTRTGSEDGLPLVICVCFAFFKHIRNVLFSLFSHCKSADILRFHAIGRKYTLWVLYQRPYRNNRVVDYTRLSIIATTHFYDVTPRVSEHTDDDTEEISNVIRNGIKIVILLFLNSIKLIYSNQIIHLIIMFNKYLT